MADPTIELASEADASTWDAFVQSRPDGSAYHQWRWRLVFEEAFGHETVYLVARRDGRIVGVLPLVLFRSALFGRFAVSLPFVNYGGVVAVDDVAAGRLLDQAATLAAERGMAHVELRHMRPRFPGLPSKTHKVSMRLPLAADGAAAWTGLDRKVRNQVRKAEKSELTVESADVADVRKPCRAFIASWAPRLAFTSPVTMLSVSIPEPTPPNEIVPAISIHSKKKAGEAAPNERGRRAPPPASAADQAEGELREPVRLGEHRRRGLAEDLRLGHLGGFGRIVGILDP